METSRQLLVYGKEALAQESQKLLEKSHAAYCGGDPESGNKSMDITDSWRGSYFGHAADILKRAADALAPTERFTQTRIEQAVSSALEYSLPLDEGKRANPVEEDVAQIVRTLRGQGSSRNEELPAV